ncbi:potassium channel family protein [Providencia stuartii]|uniref:potassium channel family protein n=1 Tax=Providencia stuartii TaxID=588 RepID=UPI0028827411|nr:potassium channel family protein [Providencia stuartii]MDK7737420.1 potassium channel family protein [Providencia stuartii]HEM8344971.1 two pore domain potassium channel family protein [Providencia stuartii]
MNITAPQTLYSKQTLIKTLHFFGVVASLFLIASISLETFRHDPFLAHSIYFDIQFWICIYFTIDFFIFLFLSKNRKKFIAKYFIIIFLSIPYLTILDYTSIQFTEEQIYLIRFIPLFRGGAAFVMLMMMVVKRNTTALFLSYIILLFSTVYFISLIFFIFERGNNAEVKNYGDAIWWAAMTVTTLGSNIIPVTTAGKVITTVLAATGMTVFPIFTVYITSVISRLSQTKKAASENPDAL